MKKSGFKKLFLFDRKAERKGSPANSRQGVSSLALLIFTAVFITATLAFVSVKFPPENNSGEGFFRRTSASVLKTFGNIFSAQEEKPVLEIDLAKNTGSSGKREEKISGARTNENNPNIAGQNKNAGNFSAPVPQNENQTATSSQLEQKIQKQIPECDFSRTGNPNHQIIFSEVNWAGSKESPNDEWMEIKNNSGNDISLDGWQIISADKNIKIILTVENKIAGGGLYLLERTNDDSAPGVTADAIYSGTLSNSGTELKIFSSDCSLSDEIIASKGWPAGDGSSRRTMERSVIDLSWHTSASINGTPKRENTAAFSKKEPELILSQPGGTQNGMANNSQNQNQNDTPATQNPEQQNQSGAAHILITEIQITGGPGKTTNDFIKIFNPSASQFNLKGYRLVKRTKSGTSDTSLKSWTADAYIPANSSYIWANSSFIPLTPSPDTTTSGSISDDNGIAVRQGPEDTGAIIDAVAWGGAQNGIAEGNSYPTNPGTNQILFRKSINGFLQDTNNNQNDFEMR